MVWSPVLTGPPSGVRGGTPCVATGWGTGGLVLLGSVTGGLVTLGWGTGGLSPLPPLSPLSPLSTLFSFAPDASTSVVGLWYWLPLTVRAWPSAIATTTGKSN